MAGLHERWEETMSVNWSAVKRKLLKEAGTYSIGDLTFLLSRKDIEIVCEMYENVNLDPPTLEDCIHYKLEMLDRDVEPFTWFLEHLSLVEQYDPQTKRRSIYDLINSKERDKKGGVIV